GPRPAPDDAGAERERGRRVAAHALVLEAGWVQAQKETQGDTGGPVLGLPICCFSRCLGGFWGETEVYGNRTHCERSSHPPLVLKTRAGTSRADTSEIDPAIIRPAEAR